MRADRTCPCPFFDRRQSRHRVDAARISAHLPPASSTRRGGERNASCCAAGAREQTDPAQRRQGRMWKCLTNLINESATRRDYSRRSVRGAGRRPARRRRIRSGHRAGVEAVRQAAEGGLGQCRPAGDLVRAGQAGGGSLGQAHECRDHLVDGEFSATKQRAAIDNMATQNWDFVAIQPFGIGTLSHPQENDPFRHTGHRHGHDDRASRPRSPLHTQIAPDNVFMGSV